jgi:3-oxoadipate CoA-transferase, beta subunit
MTDAETKPAFTPLNRFQMAWRAAQDIEDSAYVNLGLGMPTMVSNYLPEGREVMFHCENGLLGVGPLQQASEEDPNLTDAGGQLVTVSTGGALFDSSTAFMMMTGGHLDFTMLGSFQVSLNGDLANWDMMQPGVGPLVGGAMDLASGALPVRVIMAHQTRDGAPRLVESCSYPLTGLGVVEKIYTDLAVIDVTPEGFVAVAIIDGLDIAALQARTGAAIKAASDCSILSAPRIDGENGELE